MKYTTKDSGKRIQYKSGMSRDIPDGKPRYDLIVPLGQKNHLLKMWAELMERGMTKYGYRNWEKSNSIEELIRFRASAERHFRQFMDGETDECHVAAVCFNLNAMVYLMEKLGVGIDGQVSKNVL